MASPFLGLGAGWMDCVGRLRLRRGANISGTRWFSLAISSDCTIHDCYVYELTAGFVHTAQSGTCLDVRDLQAYRCSAARGGVLDVAHVTGPSRFSCCRLCANQCWAQDGGVLSLMGTARSGVVQVFEQSCVSVPVGTTTCYGAVVDSLGFAVLHATDVNVSSQAGGYLAAAWNYAWDNGNDGWNYPSRLERSIFSEPTVSQAQVHAYLVCYTGTLGSRHCDAVSCMFTRTRRACVRESWGRC
jgi:hypothetical protein